ncbi:hypothetical protein [Planosporangium mesophilum]|uniref:Uncharacterized protein n=1 Tax=Planosporangium mesophilum TaxID=689768 RepID=A0A8J3X5H6_9ACTN|nr:hypothetical protein [Planosporangium mesophilum]NJC85764.1 hypothetical protein [Planosporangium mesophilum]GII24768.1 hypothetical protein Pme01_43650 [Planosporangium mesophilum]
MAYHDAAKYIEDMNPGFVNAVGEECLRTKSIIRTALPTLDGLPGKVEWRSDAADLYERRLKETIDLAEGLHDGFDKAGQAVTAYARAQVQAQTLVADGVTAEGQLHALIAPIVATQSLQVRFSDPLRQWNDLRSTTGVTDWLIELGVHDEIEKVRAEADRLWHRATAAYDDALRIETEAREDAVGQLTAAYRLLPDFLASSPLSAKIVDETPGLEDIHGKYHVGPPTAPDLTFDDDFPYDPNAAPTPGDYASWAKWKAKLRGGQLLRVDLDDATAAYAHYMDGTGTDLRVDYEEAYREDANIRLAVDNEILSAQKEAERIYRETGQTGFQMTGNPSSVTALGGYPATENWQKALGDHTVYGTSDVVVNGNQITMKIKVHAEDMYNFNANAADIATGAPDNENGRFSTLGWAKGFPTHGQVERTVTWTIGESSDVSADTGPERNAPGEDRVDRRNNG